VFVNQDYFDLKTHNPVEVRCGYCLPSISTCTLLPPTSNYFVLWALMAIFSASNRDPQIDKRLSRTSHQWRVLLITVMNIGFCKRWGIYCLASEVGFCSKELVQLVPLSALYEGSTRVFPARKHISSSHLIGTFKLHVIFIRVCYFFFFCETAYLLHTQYRNDWE
jgi:hypothetical protein